MICALGLVVLGLCMVSIGCGSDVCPVVGIAITPSSGTADHSAPPLGNRQHFFATAQVLGTPACSRSSSASDAQHINILTDVAWSVSDPVNVTIGNTQGPTFGTATCIRATAGPVTVTAQGLGKFSGFTATATLVCQ